MTKRDAIGAFIVELSNQDKVLTEFDERLRNVVVERVEVNEDGLEFEF